MEDLACLLATPTITVSYDTTNKWLYIQWQGLHTDESVRISSEHVFTCLATYPCVKILSDHSLLLGDWQACITSVVQQNFERLAAHGVFYVAWVHSFEYSDCIAMERVVRHVTQPIVGLFDDVASAYDWLLHCQVPVPLINSKEAQYS
jgi:hypothetical protein